jgi:hypothetical protein
MMVGRSEFAIGSHREPDGIVAAPKFEHRVGDPIERAAVITIRLSSTFWRKQKRRCRQRRFWCT